MEPFQQDHQRCSPILLGLRDAPVLECRQTSPLVLKGKTLILIEDGHRLRRACVKVKGDAKGALPLLPRPQEDCHGSYSLLRPDGSPELAAL